MRDPICKWHRRVFEFRRRPDTAKDTEARHINSLLTHPIFNHHPPCTPDCRYAPLPRACRHRRAHRRTSLYNGPVGQKVACESQSGFLRAIRARDERSLARARRFSAAPPLLPQRCCPEKDRKMLARWALDSLRMSSTVFQMLATCT